MGVQVITLKEFDQMAELMMDDFEKSLKKTTTSAPQKAGMYFIKLARSVVPVDTTYLRKSIKGNKVGTGYMVSSDVRNKPGVASKKYPGGFPYNFWVDNRITANGGMYPKFQRTGLQGGGFWTHSRKKTDEYFKDVITTDISKIELVK